MQQDRPTLSMCLDPGTTDSKIIYRYENQDQDFSTAKILIMPSATTIVSAEEIDYYESRRMMNPLPESEAWVKYGGACYVTGFLGKKLGALTDKRALKYEGAIIKVLAGIGVIAAKEKVSSPHLDLF